MRRGGKGGDGTDQQAREMIGEGGERGLGEGGCISNEKEENDDEEDMILLPGGRACPLTRAIPNLFGWGKKTRDVQSQGW